MSHHPVLLLLLGLLPLSLLGTGPQAEGPVAIERPAGEPSAHPIQPPAVPSSAEATFAAEGRFQPDQSIRQEIQVVPPLEGVGVRVFAPCTLYLPPGETMTSFCLGNNRPGLGADTFQSNAQGVIQIQVPREGLYYLQALPWEDEARGMRAAFSRWDDPVFLPERSVTLPSTRIEAIGYDVSRQVTIEFGDLDGRRIAAERVEALTLRSSIGDVFDLQGTDRPWLLSQRVLRRDAGLEAVDVVYSLQSVMIDGSNVVNRGQQRFTALDAKPWQFELLLYSARIQARDAVLRRPVQGAILLHYPDGHSTSVPLDENGVARVEGLARGTYRAQIVGTGGLNPPTLFVLSRDQQVDALVIGPASLALVLGGGLLFGVGLLAFGRPRIFRHAARHLRRALRLGAPEAVERPER